MFHLKPWDIDRLKVSDFHRYIGEAKAWQDAQKGGD